MWSLNLILHEVLNRIIVVPFYRNMRRNYFEIRIIGSYIDNRLEYLYIRYVWFCLYLKHKKYDCSNRSYIWKQENIYYMILNGLNKFLFSCYQVLNTIKYVFFYILEFWKTLNRLMIFLLNFERIFLIKMIISFFNYDKYPAQISKNLDVLFKNRMIYLFVSFIAM